MFMASESAFLNISMAVLTEDTYICPKRQNRYTIKRNGLNIEILGEGRKRRKINMLRALTIMPDIMVNAEKLSDNITQVNVSKKTIQSRSHLRTWQRNDFFNIDLVFYTGFCRKSTKIGGGMEILWISMIILT